MLKIKDNVDLKELEKFGFKPKYDVDTGELEKMIILCDNYDLHERFDDGAIIKVYNFNRVLCFGTYYNTNGVITETLYDLIKANLVEKVDD